MPFNSTWSDKTCTDAKDATPESVGIVGAALAGGGAAVAVASVICPTELVKCRLQAALETRSANIGEASTQHRRHPNPAVTRYRYQSRTPHQYSFKRGDPNLSGPRQTPLTNSLSSRFLIGHSLSPHLQSVTKFFANRSTQRNFNKYPSIVLIHIVHILQLCLKCHTIINVPVFVLWIELNIIFCLVFMKVQLRMQYFGINIVGQKVILL